MVTLDIEKIEELSGQFRALSDGAIIDVEYIELSPESKKSLADVLYRKNITRENQHLMINKLTICKDGKSIIEEGQHSWIKTGNTYSISAGVRSPRHFAAQLKSLAPLRSDFTETYVCEVNLGNIEVDLSQCSGTVLDDGNILYKNVPMTLYPGLYSYKVLE